MAFGRKGTPSSSELNFFLDAAIAGNNPAILKFLEKYGDEAVNDRYNGSSAIIWAAWAGHKETVELLLEKGANPNDRDSDGWTVQLRAETRGHPDVAKLVADWPKIKEQRRIEREKIAAEKAAMEQSAVHLEKLKKSRPAKPVFKPKQP